MRHSGTMAMDLCRGCIGIDKIVVGFQSLDMLLDSGLNCTVGATVPRGDEEGAFHTADWTNPKSFRAQEVDHVAMALAAGASVSK